MFFRPILNPNGQDHLTADLTTLAEQLRLPVKNVRQWWYNDSVPGGWFERIAATKRATLTELAKAATSRDVATAEARKAQAEDSGAAA